MVDEKVSRLKTPEEVIEEFLDCAEYKTKRMRNAGSRGLTAAAQRFVSPAVDALSGQLQVQRPFSRLQFDEACSLALPEMIHLPFGDQVEYLAYHRDRFYEMDNVIARLVRDWPKPRLLDVGMSINSVILSKLLPSAQIAICDRPDYVLNEGQPFGLHSVDLTDPDLDNKVVKKKFDLIIFAEVIEHLLANPVRVLRFLLRQLDLHGYLIVTTPNFFSGGNLRALELLENPQPIFPARLKRGQEGEFHVREYSMSELLLLAEEAGGTPAAFFYSSCWEKPDSPVSPEHRANLLVVIKRRV